MKWPSCSEVLFAVPASLGHMTARQLFCKAGADSQA